MKLFKKIFCIGLLLTIFNVTPFVCNAKQFTSNAQVSNSTVSDVAGNYLWNEDNQQWENTNGYMAIKRIYGVWKIYETEGGPNFGSVYISYDDVDFPWEVTTWEFGVDGSDPLPVVTEDV